MPPRTAVPVVILLYRVRDSLLVRYFRHFAHFECASALGSFTRLPVGRLLVVRDRVHRSLFFFIYLLVIGVVSDAQIATELSRILLPNIPTLDLPLDVIGEG